MVLPSFSNVISFLAPVHHFWIDHHLCISSPLSSPPYIWTDLSSSDRLVTITTAIRSLLLSWQGFQFLWFIFHLLLRSFVSSLLVRHWPSCFTGETQINILSPPPGKSGILQVYFSVRISLWQFSIFQLSWRNELSSQIWEWDLDKLLPNVLGQEHDSCGWLQQARETDRLHLCRTVTMSFVVRSRGEERRARQNYNCYIQLTESHWRWWRWSAVLAVRGPGLDWALSVGILSVRPPPRPSTTCSPSSPLHPATQSVSQEGRNHVGQGWATRLTTGRSGIISVISNIILVISGNI